MKQVNKILICTTKTENNGMIGSGYTSWNTGELIIIKEVDRLLDAENITGIENFICIPIIRFEK